MSNSRIIAFAVGMVALVIVIVILLSFAQRAGGSINQTEDEKMFISLCRQWNNRECTSTARIDLDTAQEFYDEITLTESCKKRFPIAETADCDLACAGNKSLLLCSDVCNNNCYEELYYNLAVYSEYTTRDTYKTLIFFYVNNTGTASLQNVEIIVLNASSRVEMTRYVEDINAKSSIPLQCPVSLCGNDIRIVVDPDDKIREDNENDNVADKSWNN
jgi:tetrahydromethanopterin S-methyltransferase subunit F